MIAPLHRFPARDDAPHGPALAIRPLTLRVGTQHTSYSDNDNRRAEIDWNALCAPAAPTASPEISAAPPSTPSTLEKAAYGLAGAASLLVAVLCLVAR